MREGALLCTLICGLGLGVLAQSPELMPYPRQVQMSAGELHLGDRVTIAVDGRDAADLFAAGVLRDELAQIEHVNATVKPGSAGEVVLARSGSETGKRLLAQRGVTLPVEANAEGYALLVTPKQAAVVAANAAGILYGVETLRQLLHPVGAGAAAAPATAIVDWPALRWRAVQIDLSRGPIPSLAAFERDIPLLAEFKVNGLVLYFENTFDYVSLPLWAAPGGALNAAECTRIVALATQYHMTVIPEQEAFGHVHLGLQAERYQDLDEEPYGGLLSPAEPGSLTLISKMFAELAPVFPGPFFHIGADETSELGTGKSATMQEEQGPGELYLNYVKQIDEELQPYHRRILFWGDIAQAHPELLHELPKDVIAVPWDYSPRPSFDRLIQPFTNAGLETWVAPGVANWSRIFPDYNEALPNIANFVRDGRRLGATGLINTNWDDDGESFLDYCWYGLAYGGAVGWEDQPSLPRFQQAYDWAVYRADGHDFEQEIEGLTKIHATLQQAIKSDGSDRLMWHPAFSSDGQELYGRMAPAAHQVRLEAEDVIANLKQHRADARRNQWTLDAVDYGARRFDFVGQKAIYASYIAQMYAAAQADPTNRRLVGSMFSKVNQMNGLLQDMRDGVSSLREQYRVLWLEGNTPYFLDNMLVRYDQELNYWQSETRRFDELSAAYSRTRQLPPLIEAPSGSN